MLYLLKNYKPISLFPICSKMFERYICNELITSLNNNKPVSSNQSGVRPGGSCFNESLAVTHEYTSRLMTGLKWGEFS